MLDYIIWNVQPEIIEGFSVRWYGLFFAIGFFVSYTFLGKIFKKEGLSQKELDNFTFLVFILLIAGLRLGHCLFYEPNVYLKNPIKILYVWEGGLASHGGAVGLLTAFFIFAYRTKRTFMWVASRAAIVVPFTATMVRLGNLMNSEIYGIATDAPWAFAYLRDAVITTTPDVISAAVQKAGIVAADMQHQVVAIFSNSAEALQHGVSFTEVKNVLLQNNLISQDEVKPLAKSFIDANLISRNHPTQIYEALVYLATFGILMTYYFRRSKLDKTISDCLILSLTFLFIFTSRFIIEFIKNEQVDFEKGMQLNMGQWLSVPFILLGLYLLFLHFRNSQKAKS